jgi:phosphatidylserine synthase 2
LNHHPIYGR